MKLSELLLEDIILARDEMRKLTALVRKIERHTRAYAAGGDDSQWYKLTARLCSLGNGPLIRGVDEHVEARDLATEALYQAHREAEAAHYASRQAARDEERALLTAQIRAARRPGTFEHELSLMRTK